MTLLQEYFAARAKVDAAVDAIAERRAADLACAPGCSRCCVEGLSVWSVEAHAIEVHLAAQGLRAPPAPPEGSCAFLDAAGQCSIYEARPWVCRTHGLPLRLREPEDAGPPRMPPAGRPLPVLDDVQICALNFRERPPTPEDTLDGTALQALLLVVEQRFRARAGLPGAAERVPLASLLTSSCAEEGHGPDASATPSGGGPAGSPAPEESP